MIYDIGVGKEHNDFLAAVEMDGQLNNHEPWTACRPANLNDLNPVTHVSNLGAGTIPLWPYRARGLDKVPARKQDS